MYAAGLVGYMYVYEGVRAFWVTASGRTIWGWDYS